MVAAPVDAARSHPAVVSLELIGSRARDDPTALSDWDFAIGASDPDAVIDELPALVAPTEPLALFWDPLSTRHNLVVVVDGPHKIDLILDAPHQPRPPWTPSPDTLRTIDQHFWDWVLWLGCKHLRGQRDLVAAELAKPYDHLLGPIGVTERPATIGEAVSSYRVIAAATTLGRQVTIALAANGVVRPR